MSQKARPCGYAPKVATVDALRKENEQLGRKVKQVEKSKADSKEELRQLKAQTARSARSPASSLITRHKYTELMVSLCTNFYLLGGCSLQGVVRLLGYLNTTLQWGLRELPCKASVENWLQKAGYHQHQAACACCLCLLPVPAACTCCLTALRRLCCCYLCLPELDRAANSTNLDCKAALQAVRMKNLHQWSNEYLIANQVVRRRKTLQNIA